MNDSQHRPEAENGQSLGGALRQLRESKQMLSKEVAQHAGITPAAYSHYELGQRKPELGRLLRIAAILNATEDERMRLLSQAEYADLITTDSGHIAHSFENHLEGLLWVRERLGQIQEVQNRLVDQVSELQGVLTQLLQSAPSFAHADRDASATERSHDNGRVQSGA